MGVRLIEVSLYCVPTSTPSKTIPFRKALDNKDETSTCQRRLTKKDEKVTEMILSTSADFIDRSEDVIF